MTLAELEAAGKKASTIRSYIEALSNAEHRLATLNRYVAKHKDSHWSTDLCLEQASGWNGRSVVVTVRIPFDYIVRQAINEVVAARRAVVMAGGEVPTASEQVQRGGR
jgi:hypothetical protein